MTDWKTLAGAAIEEGRNKAFELIEQHGDFLSSFPGTALKIALSKMPGKRREPEFFSAMLREMGPDEREAYRNMLKADAQQAAAWSAQKIAMGSLWSDALDGIGDVAGAVIRLVLKEGKEALAQAAANALANATQES